jgi:uncharacterized protein YbbC (DUF1343 family)
MVRPGLEVFLEASTPSLAERRIGLITHPAAVTRELTNSTDALLAAGVNIQALFGLEHGYVGTSAATETVVDTTDPHTGLPVYSLYVHDGAFDQSRLEALDAIIFDIQDVGARYYTYLSSLYSLLKIAAETGLAVLVFDRPNPINGLHIQGPVLKLGFESEVGVAPIPIRHGMTIGELALYFAQKLDKQLDLQVFPMKGWRRSMWFDDVGLNWVPPSPGLPHLSSCLLYSGTCLLEGVNLSEGRGTALPFEILGAPWLENYEMVRLLNAADMPGVRFRAAFFTPASGKYKHETCRGLQIHVTNRNSCQPITIVARLLSICSRLHESKFEILPPGTDSSRLLFDELAGSPELRRSLTNPKALDVLFRAWDQDCAGFRDSISGILLYGGTGDDRRV